MAVGRWILLVLMVLVGPLLWWAGVAGTVSATHAALPPGDATLPYFVSNYRSVGLTMAGLFAFLNLLLLTVLLPTDRQLREGRTGTLVRAVITAFLVTGLAWFEYRFNPVTCNWSGDPDAWSLVKDHLMVWNPAVGTLWIVLNAAAATLIIVRVMVTAWSVR
ncbi:hypothetical protein O7626_24880 [Micromonospora sp. WMMD1102]|uniref:hypothetical protein n=1 Tax=Micromonospora sp. WMMD1102 TaxID=3016105 RepID=UPI002414F611|nr:hypothetical protein [Micromonospora sp. WMMD1102]MDG4789128.1 hypothetical protein [Micromonospora sp. WMMD1102]